MKREDCIAHNPERTIACLVWGDVPEEWKKKYKEVRKWYVVAKRIWKESPDWATVKTMEPPMKKNVNVSIQYIHDAQQIFDALCIRYRWLCVPNSDLPLALVQGRETPRDNDLVVLVAPRVEV